MVPNIKKDLEKLYDGLATVYCKDSSTVDEHGITRQADVVAYTDIPCRISYRNKASNEQDAVGALNQIILMFCDPQYDIPSGSTIEIAQYGQTHTYKSSGLPAMYNSHQEIELRTFEEYA